MTSDRIVRGALIGLGVLAVARGAWLVLVGLPPRVWLPIGLWLAVGIVANDLVLAPVSLLLGRLLKNRFGRPVVLRVAGNALRGAWLALGTVLLVAGPLLVGAGQRANPTVIPGRPGVNLLLSLALVAAGTSAVILVNLLRVSRRQPTSATG
jgi:hypothetical protein